VIESVEPFCVIRTTTLVEVPFQPVRTELGLIASLKV
jgi:hypothetical protein